MTIKLYNFLDAKGCSRKQSWQKLFIEVEKVKILNGISVVELKLFEVSNDSVKLQYEAKEFTGSIDVKEETAFMDK